MRAENRVHKREKSSSPRSKTFCFVCRSVNTCKCNPRNENFITFSDNLRPPARKAANIKWRKFLKDCPYFLNNIKYGCTPEKTAQANAFLTRVGSTERIATVECIDHCTVITDKNVLRALIIDGITSRELNNNYDYSSITDMEGLFLAAGELTSIPKLYTDRVTTMRAMFSGCSNLRNVEKFNTNNVQDMSNMFLGCSSLQGTPHLSTKNVANMSSMFQGCTSIKKAPHLNTVSVAHMEYMFANCDNIKTVPKYNLENIYQEQSEWAQTHGTHGMFLGCHNLRDLDMANYTDYDFSTLDNKFLREKYPEFFI